MSSNGASDPTEVIARIRERVRARHAGEGGASRPRPPLPAFTARSSPGYDLGELHSNLAACNALHSAVGTLNPRRPGLHNRAIQFAKKVMRRSLTWYTRPLHEFHGAVTRTLNHTTIALEETRDGLGVLEARVEGLEQRFEQAAASLRGLQRDLRRLQEEVRVPERAQATPAAAAAAGQAAPAALQTPQLDFDYFMFEEHFRGPESEIKRRQQAYLEYFRGCSDVWDLGCGRGEFLELMREHGIAARGVETGKDAFLLCQEKGLAVEQQDLFSCLESLADESAGGIFSGQVIEHLPPALQLRLVNLAQQKLRPGAPLVIETINPECVYALCRNFYLDPTHVRPVHPEMLAFAMRSAGFHRVDIKYSSPQAERQLPKLVLGPSRPELEAFNRALVHVNDLLFGFQDYAAVGWR
jgi:O-antigen chain-terminating methyltransferase